MNQILPRAARVRPYEPKDIPRLTAMLMNAIPQLPNYSMLTPDADKIKYALTHGVAGAAYSGWVLCDLHDRAQGCSAGWCVPSILSHDMVADDIFMWIEPAHRSFVGASLLVQAYVDWAKGKGAKLIRASHTGGSWPKGSREFALFDLLLKRLNFHEVGSVYHLSMEN